MTTSQLLKRLRDQPLLNRAASSTIRSVAGDRVPEWIIRHLPRHGVVSLDVPGHGTVHLWSGDDWMTSRVWWLGLDGFERGTMAPFLWFAERARTVLDVGAYTGYFSVLAAAMNPAARVFAFEPNPTVAAQLGRNLALNPDLTVVMVPHAVGAARGTAELHLGGPGLPSSSSLAAPWQGLHRSIPVSVVDLQSFCKEWSIDGVDVVKIDVESYEPAVIEGMGDLLSTDRPVIFTEVLPGADEGYRRMSELLAHHDYRFFHLTPAGAVPEEVLVAPAHYVDHISTDVNHLVCPAERVPDWLAQGGTPTL